VTLQLGFGGFYGTADHDSRTVCGAIPFCKVANDLRRTIFDDEKQWFIRPQRAVCFKAIYAIVDVSALSSYLSLPR